MIYLHGDSTPSPYPTNHIELLRRILDFSVSALQADLRLIDGRDHRASRERRSEAELEALDTLSESVLQALRASSPASSTPAARFSQALTRAVLELTRAERETTRAGVSGDMAVLDSDAAREREGCVRALETLILKVDPPDAARTITITSDGTRGTGRLFLKTPYGLELAVELELPAAHPLAAHDLRVERLGVEALEVHAPESGGVFRKQTRLTPHKLGKHHVVELTISPDDTRLQLRELHEKHAPGFDVVITHATRKVEVTRISKEGDLLLSDSGEGETMRFLDLDEKLRAAAEELGNSRRALLEATLDGKPLGGQDRPALLVHRLVESIAPAVREISRRSLATTELVLKRAMADNRREEIFVSKAELRQKLAVLPEAQQTLFSSLDIWEGNEPKVLAEGSASPAVTTISMIADDPPAHVFSRQPTSELSDGDLMETGERPQPPPPPEPSAA
jgi:hypothetical protein